MRRVETAEHDDNWRQVRAGGAGAEGAETNRGENGLTTRTKVKK